MATKYKVKTKAVFNGQPVGSTIEMDGKTAKKYEALKYLEIIEEIKAKPKPAKKAKSAPKKPAKTSAKKKSDKEEGTPMANRTELAERLYRRFKGVPNFDLDDAQELVDESLEFHGYELSADVPADKESMILLYAQKEGAWQIAFSVAHTFSLAMER